MADDGRSDPLDRVRNDDVLRRQVREPLKRSDARLGFGTGGNELASTPSVQPSARNYRCPACGGEFNQWDRVGERGTMTVGVDDRDELCPFCGLERRSYEPEEAAGD